MQAMRDLLLWAGVMIAAVSAAIGQTTNGTILGIVADPAGAAVPGAGVLVVNEQTGVRRDIATNSEGLYQALALPSGLYSVSVTASGFQPTTYRGVVLQVQQTARFNITLSIQQQGEA